jgi:transposase
VQTVIFTKNQIESERKDIDSVDNTIVVGEDTMRGITKQRSWSAKHNIYTHVFYNAALAFQNKERLYGHVAKLKLEAMKSPNNPKFINEYEKYLIIRKSEKTHEGYTINIRRNEIEKRLQYSGWMVILSNHINDAHEAIRIYRSKDVVEKGFYRMKNCLDLGRLRVHSDIRMQNKIFIGFIALIVMAHIHKVMSSNDMYAYTTLKKMIKSLGRLRVQYINGNRILFPCTAEQKSIFNAFGISVPV